MPWPPALTEIYQTNTVVGLDGSRYGAHSIVVREFAEALHNLVLRERPSTVVEIGMAQGVTTLAIASALDTNGSGRMIAIDPFQSTDWHGAGIAGIERAGLDHVVEVVEEPDYIALPRLLASGLSVDLAYIDGRHSLEYAMLDVFYIDRMLRTGGVVGFNDSDWPPILRTIHFLERHRHYDRIDVGLPALWGERNRLTHLYMRVEHRVFGQGRRPSQLRPIGRMVGRRRDDRYYRKQDSYEPPEGWMPYGWSLGR